MGKETKAQEVEELVQCAQLLNGKPLCSAGPQSVTAIPKSRSSKKKTYIFVTHFPVIEIDFSMIQCRNMFSGSREDAHGKKKENTLL